MEFVRDSLPATTATATRIVTHSSFARGAPFGPGLTDALSFVRHTSSAKRPSSVPSLTIAGTPQRPIASTRSRSAFLCTRRTTARGSVGQALTLQNLPLKITSTMDSTANQVSPTLKLRTRRAAARPITLSTMEQRQQLLTSATPRTTLSSVSFSSTLPITCLDKTPVRAKLTHSAAAPSMVTMDSAALF
jgi:hypothetical protein